MGRDAELSRLLDESATLNRDPAGTTIGALLREAGEEALAHGRAPAARTYFGRALRWYADRIRDRGATHADSIATATSCTGRGDGRKRPRWRSPAPALRRKLDWPA